MAHRSILKRPSATPRPASSPRPAVHFPPSPSLASTFAALPAVVYDRSPIVVGYNTCELPERGCPGRTYTIDDHLRSRSRKIQGSSAAGFASASKSIHPRALARSPGATHTDTPAAYPYPPASASTFNCPPLIPDISSSSDESDGSAGPPPVFDDYAGAVPKHPSVSPKHRKAYPQSIIDIYTPPPPEARAFLPYAPAEPTIAHSHPYERHDCQYRSLSLERRAPSKERRPCSTSRDRRPRSSSTLYSPDDEDEEYDDTRTYGLPSASPSVGISPRPSRDKQRRRSTDAERCKEAKQAHGVLVSLRRMSLSSSSCNAYGEWDDDGGCLGGF
ncbi:hypothetical protein FISHEDRAFT_77142 [Fistulina hepatica ATCC 64428]|uniref:Uncharacterized protein n=1 Tax=Fistulina hepatica ATCC 64428 TaxID=1128425 RepID=A0A0D7A4U1_9AGAR|nr:hypothetical protein FISHEDRAFT_77142 [Fistulina hepatica ATCC 64428]